MCHHESSLLCDGTVMFYFMSVICYLLCYFCYVCYVLDEVTSFEGLNSQHLLHHTSTDTTQHISTSSVDRKLKDKIPDSEHMLVAETHKVSTKEEIVLR